MQRTFLLTILALALCLTGCPKEDQQTKTVPAEAPQPAQSTSAKPVAPKPTLEPSTEEAKQAFEFIKGLGGEKDRCVLTPEGTVKQITVDSSALTGESFDLFGKQSDMETLEVSNFRELNDSMIDKLSDLKKLRKLKLTNSGLTDAGVRSIVQHFPELKDLDLSSNTLLTDESIKEIVKLQELESLAVIYCDFSEFAMMDLSSHPKLKNLDIRANMQVGNIGMDFISKLSSLKSLKHMCGAVDDSGMQSLSAAKGLESLEIQDFNITDTAGQSIRAFEGLKNLSVFRCGQFGSGGLLEMKGAGLTRLTLRDLPAINDSGMDVFREMPSLRRLYLRELASLSDAGMINLVYLKDLEVLDINEVPITDKSLESIAKLPNLKVLNIRLTDVTDAGVEHLLTMPKLVELSLKNNPGVTEVMKTKLRDSKKFRKLDFVESVPKR